MEGFIINKQGSEAGDVSGDNSGKLLLLAKNGNLEIMSQRIQQGATVWLVPSGSEHEIEFFYICEGGIDIDLDGEIVSLCPGESFYARGTKKDLLIKTTADTLMLYISTMPVFDAEVGFQAELTHLLEQINEKDDYTFRHSRNVMRYSVRLYERLKQHCRQTNAVNSIVVASLFHDVGKCRVPDAVLKRRGPLTPSEFREIQNHPIDSANILSHYFDEHIMELARCHHERLDGSGYPQGLKGDVISFEARILAVADSFDAMTTNRGYNIVRTPIQAALELAEEPHHYDTRITKALVDLVHEGKIHLSEADDPVPPQIEKHSAPADENENA